MGWGKEWPVNEPISEFARPKEGKQPWPSLEIPIVNVGVAIDEIQKTKSFELIKEYNNKVPTHDPYTNPGAFVYYECNCGSILDPKTKSFAGLNNAAMSAGWKIRWKESGEGYQPYCPKCGEGVE